MRSHRMTVTIWTPTHLFEILDMKFLLDHIIPEKIMVGLRFNWRDGSLDYNLESKIPCYSIVTFRLAYPLPAALFLFGTKSQGGEENLKCTIERFHSIVLWKERFYEN